jgi:hypothetical protein
LHGEEQDQQNERRCSASTPSSASAPSSNPGDGAAPDGDQETCMRLGVVGISAFSKKNYNNAKLCPITTAIVEHSRLFDRRLLDSRAGSTHPSSLSPMATLR